MTEFVYDAINRRAKQTVMDRTAVTSERITEWTYHSRNVVAVLVRPTVVDAVVWRLDVIDQSTNVFALVSRAP